MRLFSLLKKEMTQLMRDRVLLFILLWGFTGMIYIAGHGVSMEVRNFPTIVYDMSYSPESRELISRFQKPYFKILAFVQTEREVIEWLDSGKASMAVIIPADFKRKIDRSEAKIQVIIDGTMSMSATMAVAYVSSITYNYAIEVFERKMGITNRFFNDIPFIDERTRIHFNPNILTSWFMSLLEFFNVTTMVSLLVTAAALVREKEYGTVEQLLVTPVRTWEIFFAKITPTIFAVGILSFLSIFFVIKGIFKVPIRGSLFLFYPVMLFYVFTMSSLGIAIATVARNLAQSMMLMLVILTPMLMLSGAWTPPESMQPLMQYLSLISPMRYFIDFGYSVLFKGNGIKYVWHDIVGIILLGAVLFGFSVYRFRKTFAK
ncbi:ABC transporter permease [Thermodesulfovibrio yellowstonii]|uniref:ABC transporter n=1 Tax=Thermodesulfovibrio yellowstonii TaxID=28262 RepID=A0A9W6GFI0_9BACT|nr:ABC transporter permease [Thermodesulfovibrio islandicus]GLI53040.1 ABC transporter [Thermodesulfovibrio islandicus]